MSNGVWWNSWDFKYKISWNPMGSDEIHEILSIKSYEIQWDLMYKISDLILMGFKYKILWNPMGSDEIYEGFKYKILWNAMGSYEIHGVLSIKSHVQIQWEIQDLMKSWDFKYKISWNPMMKSNWIYDEGILSIKSLMKSNGIWWDLWGF